MHQASAFYILASINVIIKLTLGLGLVQFDTGDRPLDGYCDQGEGREG